VVRGDIPVELVRPDGPASVGEWFPPLRAVDRADWPADPGWFLHERIALANQPGVVSCVLGLSRLGNTVAGCFQVRMPVRDNREYADIEIFVDPALQGRGVGRALLTVAERVAADRGRTVLAGTTEGPLDSPDLERRDRFALEAGYEPALEEARRELDLPVDPSRLDALDEEARTFAKGYRVVRWTGPCPDEWVEGRVQVGRSMSTDRPQGELDVEPESWDAGRLRQFERVVAAMDRATVAVGAVAPDGALVGFSEVGIPRATPTVAYQFDTVVTAAHRGHRLGLLLKVANVRAVKERFPSVRRIVTINAVSNEPMIRVNERVGFRLTGAGTVWQKRERRLA
jgi:GNAT superfamily N-acetyltransferase